MYVAMRLGPLVRLLVGVAVVTVLVLVVIMAQAPAHGTGGPATPSSTLAVAGALPLFRITRTDGGGLSIRGCPSSDCARVGWVGEGGSFTADCSVTGSAEHGDVTWLLGTVGGHIGYAARYYLVPAGADPTVAAGVPACDRLAAAKG